MKARHALELVAVLVCAGYLGYRYLLSDTAKDSLTRAVESTQEAYEQMKQALNGQDGERSERQARINKARTAEQWSQLGF